MNVFDSPEGFFFLFVGLFLLGEIIKAGIAKGASSTREKAKTKHGIVVILVFVAIIWIIFAKEIAVLLEFVNTNGIIIMSFMLIIIAVLVWKFKGSNENEI